MRLPVSNGGYNLVDREKGSVERGLLPVIHGEILSDPHLCRILECNQVIKHNYRYAAPCRVPCGLLGCKEHFDVTLIPHQVLYPKYCPRHRSEYQRRRQAALLQGK